MVLFNELLQQGTISRFPTTEKDKRQLYIEFHKTAYQEDITTANTLKNHSHRWSVTAAYYAMLNITKLYLAKHHNISINERSHLATRIALEQVITEKHTKKHVIELLKKAEEQYDSFATNKQPKILATMLRAAQQKREKSNYYSHPPPQRQNEDLNSFFKSIVEPYITILEEMT